MKTKAQKVKEAEARVVKAAESWAERFIPWDAPMSPHEAREGILFRAVAALKKAKAKP